MQKGVRDPGTVLQACQGIPAFGTVEEIERFFVVECFDQCTALLCRVQPLVQQAFRLVGVIRKTFHEDFLLEKVIAQQKALVSFELIEQMEGKSSDFQFSQCINVRKQFLEKLRRNDFDPAAEPRKHTINHFIPLIRYTRHLIQPSLIGTDCIRGACVPNP